MYIAFINFEYYGSFQIIRDKKLEFKSTKSQQSTNKSHEVAPEESSMKYLDNFAIYDCVQ